MALTKAGLVEKVADAGQVHKVEALEIVEDLLDLLRETFARGEQVKISGFGVFTISQKKARNGRNPHTGEEITITPRRVLTFKPSIKLRQAVNGEPG